MAEFKPVFEVEPFDLFAREPLPEAQWLIEPLFELDSQVVLWGESGSGKSFVALSFATHIATGTPWLGTYPVRKTNVLYCAGEGGRGMRRRGRAAAIEYGFKSIPGLSFLEVAPRLRDPKVLAEFLKVVKSRGAGFVVIDTLARSYTGDENSSEHMNDWLHAASLIQRETGACVMVVHHTAKNVKKGLAPTERGSGALRGAMDTSIRVIGGEFLTLNCVKQKDDSRFPDITLQLKPVVLREATPLTKALTSVVVVPFEETLPGGLMPGATVYDIALAALDEKLTTEEWRLKTIVEGKVPPVSTFYRWIRKLEADEVVAQDPDSGKWANKIGLVR